MNNVISLDKAKTIEQLKQISLAARKLGHQCDEIAHMLEQATNALDSLLKEAD